MTVNRVHDPFRNPIEVQQTVNVILSYIMPKKCVSLGIFPVRTKRRTTMR